jgi:hypothetical protein
VRTLARSVGVAAAAFWKLVGCYQQQSHALQPLDSVCSRLSQPCCVDAVFLLLQLFPGSDWVAANAALAHYNMRNFDEAQVLYEDLLARDPARLAVRGCFAVVGCGYTAVW